MRDPGFFSVGLATNNAGDPVLQGNLVSILNGASELAILAMGMTLVTAACGGQDISVGAVAAIAGSVFVKVLKSGGIITPGLVLLALPGLLRRGNAVRILQRHAGGCLPDPAHDRHADPVYLRPQHRLLDQRRRHAHRGQPHHQRHRQLHPRAYRCPRRS